MWLSSVVVVGSPLTLEWEKSHPAR